MTVVEKVKDLIAKGMKERSPNVGILRVVLGEFQRNMKDPSDDICYKIIKKIIESNEELLKIGSRIELATENEILRSLLPEEMSSDEMITHLAIHRESIIAAASEGQAIGIAMKILKAVGKDVNSGKVKTLVVSLRN